MAELFLGPEGFILRVFLWVHNDIKQSTLFAQTHFIDQQTVIRLKQREALPYITFSNA